MNIEIKPIKLEEKEILNNIIQLYAYEFSQYDKLDIDNLGEYDYYLDDYWIEDNHWTYFNLVEVKLSGFAIVNTFSDIEDRKAKYDGIEIRSDCCY